MICVGMYAVCDIDCDTTNSVFDHVCLMLSAGMYKICVIDRETNNSGFDHACL